MRIEFVKDVINHVQVATVMVGIIVCHVCLVIIFKIIIATLHVTQCIFIEMKSITCVSTNVQIIYFNILLQMAVDIVSIIKHVQFSLQFY